MELTRACAIVFMIATSKFVTSSPHGYGGYGVKGGAAAKVQAAAAAGAFAGAGAGALPIGLPPGAGFSGSFSKSSSSSFAASSASSSASSFSFSGSGVSANGAGCTSGICPGGQASNINGQYSPNGNSNGFYNGANSLAGAQAGAFGGSQISPGDINGSSCSGNNCPNKKGSACQGTSCNDFSTPENKCESGNCDAVSSSVRPSDINNEANKKCEFGQCGSGAASSAQSTGYTNDNIDVNTGNTYNKKCPTGNCGSTSPVLSHTTTNGVTASDVVPSEFEYGGNPDSTNRKCTSGQCAPTQTSTSAKDISSPGYGSDKCTSGQCGTTSGNTGYNAPPSHGYNSNTDSPNYKCTSGQCSSTPAKDSPYPGYGSSKCTSGQCNSNHQGLPSTSTDDIPVNFPSGSTSNYGSNSPYYDKSSSTSSGRTPGCTSGNCGTFSSSNPTPTYQLSSTIPAYSAPSYSNKNIDTPKCNSPNCNNEVHNHHAFAAGSASAPAYNKPVTYLTTPKHEPPCTSPQCQSSGSNLGTPGQYPSGSISAAPGAYPTYPSNKNPTCAGGNCQNTQYPTLGSNLVTPLPNYPNTNYKPSESKCASPNCKPSFSQVPSYQPTQSLPSQTTASGSVNYPNTNYKPSESKCASPNCKPSFSQVPSYQPTQSLPSQTTASGSVSNYNSQNHYQGLPSPVSPSTSSQTYNPSVNPSTSGLSYTTIQPTSQNDVSNSHPESTQPIKPNYISTLPTAPTAQQPNNSPYDDGSVPPFVPLNPSSLPNCAGNACSVAPSSHPNYGPNVGPIRPGENYNSGQWASAGTNYQGGSSQVTPDSSAYDKNAEKPYLGGFGGASGFLKPNEYDVSSKLPAANNKPSTTTDGSQPPQCVTGNCKSGANQPYQGHNVAGNTLGPQVEAQNTVPCRTGNCGNQNGQSSTFNVNGSHASAIAVATAGAYTGGFGGPPGLLTPFDNGKSGNGLAPGFGGKNAGIGNHQSPTNGGHTNYNHGLTGGAQTGAGAQAIAVAGARAGAITGSPHSHGAPGGCGGGCGESGSHGTERHLDLNAGLGHSKAGYGGSHDAVSGAAAAAKAGAASFGGNYASAHASSGAAVKGGYYGRR